MLTDDGWFDWMPRLPLDARLMVNGGRQISLQPNRMEFVTCHYVTVVWPLADAIRHLLGRWPTLNQAEQQQVINALLALYWPWRDPERPTTGWQVTNFRRVPFAAVQHAPITMRLAHGHAANPRSPGIEAEGTAAMELDDAQRETMERMLWDLHRAGYPRYTRGNGGLHYHREHGPTDCPGRMYDAWFASWETATPPQEDDPMTPEERAQFAALKQEASRAFELAWRASDSIVGRPSSAEASANPAGAFGARRARLVARHPDSQYDWLWRRSDADRAAIDELRASVEQIAGTLPPGDPHRAEVAGHLEAIATILRDSTGEVTP